MTDSYTLVSISWEDVKANIDEQKERGDLANYEFTQADCDEIAEELSYNYEHDWDYDTAIEGQIEQFLQQKGLCTKCCSSDLVRPEDVNVNTKGYVNDGKKIYYPICNNCGSTWFGELHNIEVKSK